MTNEIVPVNDHKEEAPHNTKEFKGYSIEELRYQRALIALRKDFCRSKMVHNADRVRKRGFFGRNGTTSPSCPCRGTCDQDHFRTRLSRLCNDRYVGIRNGKEDF